MASSLPVVLSDLDQPRVSLRYANVWNWLRIAYQMVPQVKAIVSDFPFIACGDGLHLSTMYVLDDGNGTRLKKS